MEDTRIAFDMTMLCTSCGHPLDDDAYRCSDCGALAPLPPIDDARYPRTVFDQPPAASTGPAVDDPSRYDTEALPWAIPIRERPAAVTARRDPLRLAMYAALVVALLAGVVVVGAQLLSAGGGADAASTGGDPQPAAASSTSSTVAATSTTDPVTSTTTESTTTSTEPTTTTTAPASPTTITTGQPSPGSARQLSSSFQGGWIAQLTSVPTSAGTDAVEAAWHKATTYAADAVVARSDAWTSLQPGYWVVVDTGPFGSADDVRAFCASIDHADQSDCLARQLSGRR